jgi:hypothetical protein
LKKQRGRGRFECHRVKLGRRSKGVLSIRMK